MPPQRDARRACSSLSGTRNDRKWLAELSGVLPGRHKTRQFYAALAPGYFQNPFQPDESACCANRTAVSSFRTALLVDGHLTLLSTPKQQIQQHPWAFCFGEGVLPHVVAHLESIGESKLRVPT